MMWYCMYIEDIRGVYKSGILFSLLSSLKDDRNKDKYVCR